MASGDTGRPAAWQARAQRSAMALASSGANSTMSKSRSSKASVRRRPRTNDALPRKEYQLHRKEARHDRFPPAARPVLVDLPLQSAVCAS
eukprot:scaffold1214_cov349-Prasinococcus_capsulatus_cf.AAC.2